MGPESTSEANTPASTQTSGLDEERVRVRCRDGVAIVSMTRTDKHNGLDPRMFSALADAAKRVRLDRSIRVVIVHGEGPSFCSGLDFKAFAGAGDGGVAEFTKVLDEPPPNYFQRAAYDWIELEVPVIAAIHGNCFGGGLQIALGADIRIAAPDSRLSVLEIKWGLIPDMAITRSLPRVVGIDVAKELTYTGRMISGAEADGLGLVTRCAPDPMAAARELAAEIATKSPDAIRRAKRLYDLGWSGTAPETLALEAQLQGELLGTRNQLAEVAAGLSRQPAEFEDPQSSDDCESGRLRI